MLSFNADRHEYTVNGVLVPSVTQILASEGFTSTHYTDESARRGTWVHEATVLIDGWKDTGAVPESYEGYIKAYLAFIARSMPQWTGSEVQRHRESWGFAGTIDRTTEGQIWDIKTGPPRPADQLQLAGYAMLLDDRELERWNLYLKADGTFDTILQRDKKDFVIFSNAVVNHAWKRNRGSK